LAKWSTAQQRCGIDTTHTLPQSLPDCIDSFWQNWSAKVEYDFYDFGTQEVTFTGTILGVPEVVSGVNVKQTINTVKFGIHDRFGPIAGADARIARRI
jgi:hypothetical protein